jgi:NAD(P)-dependent dehydrogenase (short-subunit alcohol dehydrogenase family)
VSSSCIPDRLHNKIRNAHINMGFTAAVKLAVHYMNKKETRIDGNSSNGLIICTASNAGIYPFPVAPLYAASKSGVIGLVRSTARLIAGQNIQINALAPAVIGE